ncbi:hypothetical protein [Haliangium sp.]|uniref:hypothetical protein n=1 Tax=Haliangium sp. TaxID=2663208 RepID=UPI003D10E9B6
MAPRHRRPLSQARAVLLLAAPLTLAASGCVDSIPMDSDDHTDVSGLTCTKGLIEAAHDIASRYPNWGAAHHDIVDSSDKIWFHPAHQKKEIEGFGVTLVTMHYTVVLGVKIPSPNDAHWHGDLNEPTLLFFEKQDGVDTDDWPLIGFGYHVDWSDDEGMGGCVRPEADCTTSDTFVNNFIVHEAGYHIEGFKPVDDDDLKSGRGSVDADYCNVIDKNDVKDPDGICVGCEAEGVGGKHGRAWTMHVWVHPSWKYPLISATDPWNRDDGDGWEYTVEARSFGVQGDCDCDPDPQPPPSPVMGEDAGARVVAASFLDELAQQAQEPISPMYGTEVTEIRDNGDQVLGYRIVEMSWFYQVDDLGLLTGDLVRELADQPIRGWGDFVEATQRIADLPPGALFTVRLDRDQEPRTLLFRVGPG